MNSGEDTLFTKHLSPLESLKGEKLLKVRRLNDREPTTHFRLDRAALMIEVGLSRDALTSSTQRKNTRTPEMTVNTTLKIFGY